MSDIKLRIMIVDDNPAIHQDFIKVLTQSSRSSELDYLDKQLFGEDNIEMDASTSSQDDDYALPEFIFETASQGAEAVEKVRQALLRGEVYSLAFVDVRMPPGLDGIETIRRMWDLDPDIQMVICTAYSDYTWEETVKKLGRGDNYLILKKPFDMVAVRQLACALTRKWILAKDSKQYTQKLQQTVEEKTKSLQESISLLRSTIESSADGILVIDLNYQLIDFNSKFLEMWHIPESLLQAKKVKPMLDYMLDQLIQSDNYVGTIKELGASLEAISRHTVYFKDGKILECCSHPHRMNDAIIGRVWSFRDITERAMLEQKLEYQASHDMLTSLPNRVLLVDRIEQAIQHSMRHKQRFAVLFFDLDRFKLVNDSLSHKIGDELLCLVAKRLLELVRKVDTLARIGGDEFVMIVPELKKEESILTISNKILQSFKQPFTIENREIIVSTSIGISLYPTDGKTVSTLLKKADLAMYKAKEQGGNQFQYYTSQLNEKTNQRFKQEADLHRAIEREEFILVYQPQFDIENNNILSVEALIRWQHPEKGLLLPLDFIQVAENCGLIVPIGEWVLRAACKQIIQWRNHGMPWIRVAVNIATLQLKQVNFAKVLQGILNEYQIPPEYLELEITENVVITHPDIINMLHQLKTLGVKIVLDDFGTGNSSLNYLKKIDFDGLKIDQSFIKNISKSRSDEVIVEAIIAMARSFNYRVLAEGVENQVQMSFLKAQHCDEVQGFLFSQPLTPKDIEAFMVLNKEKNQ